MTNSTAQPQASVNSPPDGSAADRELPLLISHDEMTGACEQGGATVLDGGIDGVIWHAGTWWVSYERGWLRIVDEQVLADLDQAAERLATARAAGDRLRQG